MPLETSGNAAMETVNLPPVAKTDAARMAQARRQIHNGAVWLARMANSYLPPEADQRHLRLTWLAESALASQTFGNGLSLRLKLPELHLQFLEDGVPVKHVFDMEDHTAAETEAWILVELLHRGVERERFSKNLPFEIATPITGDSEKYAPESVAHELSLLTSWLSAGAMIIGELTRNQASSPTVATATVWMEPEPLRLGGLVASPKGVDAVPLQRIGFSLGDQRTAEPYFFIVPQNHGSVQSLHPAFKLTATEIETGAMSADEVRRALAAAVVEAPRAPA
jgi:hypothetical protein